MTTLDEILHITPSSPHWPVGLNDLGRDMPTQLWVRGEGNLADLTRTSVAIVGSRSATMYGEQVAVDLSSDLAEHRYTIVSGGAYGIDAAAHRGALAVAGDPGAGRTVVVLACGVDVPTPQGNLSIFDHVLRSGGLLVSEVEPGGTPTRSRLLARNRIIAGLTKGTVVVEASELSGSLSTANWARRFGRLLMAVPGPVTSGVSQVPNRLIQEGSARLVTNFADVILAIGDAS